MPTTSPPLRPNIVLIDYENVQPKAQELADLAAEHFQIFVFVGANQARVPVDFAAELQKKGKPSELVQISGNGKNAADFHMALYLGQLASKDPDAYFHVISKDTGFAPLISHLKERHQLLAKRWLQIGDIPWVNIAKAKSDDERARLIIAKLREAKSGLPATRKALATFICVNFFKRLSDESVARIVSVMERLKAIAFNGEKITYAL